MSELRTTTYTLKMSRQGEMIRDHRCIKNKHIQTEDGQTMCNGQSNFMDGSKTTTYRLKMDKQGEIIRVTSPKN